MRRILLKMGVVLILSLMTLVVAQHFVVKDMLERRISSTLGVDVSIDAVHLGWNEFTVRGLVVDNVSEASLSPALSARKLQLRASWSELLGGDVVTVRELVIEDPSLVLETFDSSGRDNNWSRMLGISSHSGSVGSRKWVIKSLRVTGISLRLRHPVVTEETLHPHVSDIELENVTSLSQIPTTAVTQAVMDQVLRESMIQVPQLAREVLGESHAVIEDGADGVRRVIDRGARTMRSTINDWVPRRN